MKIENDKLSLKNYYPLVWRRAQLRKIYNVI